MAFPKLDIPAIVLGETRVSHASVQPGKTVPGILCRCYNCHKEFGICVGDFRRGRGLFCTQHCNREYRTRSPEHRFWSKVNKTESCWLWTGAKQDFGHGVINISIESGNKLTHRLSWEIHNGPIPDGLVVCHNCPGGDNPSCVNPAHLFLGTQADNIHDAIRKGTKGYLQWRKR